ncbi:MAG TPA: hypothetical protein VGC54_00090 [Planctomycetota bacterium]
MRLRLDLDLEGLEDALAPLLPARMRPESLEIADGRLRLRARAGPLGAVVLLAHVNPRAGGVCLSRFDLEGAGLLKSVALGKLRDRVAGLERTAGAFQLYGESDGSRLHVTWGEGR